MDGILNQISIWMTAYGLKFVGAILILIAGRVVAGLGRKLVGKMMTKAKVEPTVVSFTKSLTFFGLLAAAVLAALAKFGVQTTSFVAVLGAAGLAVGLALQGSLANFAAGVLLLVLRPFKVGDYVEAGGTAGTVKEIQLFTTTLASPDNIKIMIPNNKVFSDTIKNITAYDTRRVDMVIGISYDSPIGQATEIIDTILKTDSRVLADPAPKIAVSELADSSVNLIVRPWVAKDDYWAVKWELTRLIKEAFDQAGIEIPFPQTVVHMAKDD